MSDGKNPYEILGVNRSMSQEEIKAAYRKLAFENHPDKNPGDPGASLRFQRIVAAWNELETPEKRAATDARLNEELLRALREIARSMPKAAVQPKHPPPKPPPVHREKRVNWAAWGLGILGAAFVGGLATAAARSGDTYDPRADRYRGPDGRFTRG
jgi:hypothetical protein